MINIIIDIETAPTARADIRERVVANVSPPGNYKKPETIDQWWKTEGDAKKADAIARTALDGTWGEIVCIGFAVNDEPADVIMRNGISEEKLLMEFGTSLDLSCRNFGIGVNRQWEPLARWIGHNIIDFDLRYLWQRSKILRVELPFELPIKTRPSDADVFDTMREWCRYREMISLKDLELAFDIERIDPLANSAEVCAAYAEGRFADIAEHCRIDIENTRQIYQRMTSGGR